MVLAHHRRREASGKPPDRIFDPGQNDQTIGSQIVALGNGHLVNVMTVFKNETTATVSQGRELSPHYDPPTGAQAVAARSPRFRWELSASPTLADGEHDGLATSFPRSLPRRALRAATRFYAGSAQDARISTASQRDQARVSRCRGSQAAPAIQPPVRISTHNQTQPGVHAGDPRRRAQGNIGVTYYDFRNDNSTTTALDTDALVHPLQRRRKDLERGRLTPQSFNMRLAPDANGFFGRLRGLSALGTTFYPFWSQSDGTGTSVFARRHCEAPFPRSQLQAFGNRVATHACLGLPGRSRASRSRGDESVGNSQPCRRRRITTQIRTHVVMRRFFRASYR